MPKRPAQSRGAGKSRPGPARGRGTVARGGKTKPGSKSQANNAKKQTAKSAPAVVEPPWGTLRLGLFVGATVGRWVDSWRERYPRQGLELIWLEPGSAGSALEAGEIDIALSRLPLIVGASDSREELFSTSTNGFNIIPLYEETTVAICGRDSILTAADELNIADLAGEVLLRSVEDPVSFDVPGTVTPKFEQLETLADAVATVAAGVGFMLVPMSVARVFERKDLRYIPVRDLPLTPVALCWLHESAAVTAFMGVVRGRSANSSRA